MRPHMAVPSLQPFPPSRRNQPPGNICYRKLPLSNSLSHCAAFCKHRVIFFPNKKGAPLGCLSPNQRFGSVSCKQPCSQQTWQSIRPPVALHALHAPPIMQPYPAQKATKGPRLFNREPLAKVSESKPSGGTDPSALVTRPYANSLRPASSSAFSSASAASRLASFANTYSLIFGSVPLGRTITLLPPSTSNSTTFAAGRPFTPCW